MKHVVDLIVAPDAVTAMCSCGWSHRETRRQNSFARAFKIRAATRKHLDSVGGKKHGKDTDHID